MKRPILVTALRLAADNRRLLDANDRMLRTLALANRTAEQAMHERDDALALVVDLRADNDDLRAEATDLHALVRVLMQSAPSDIREMET